MKLPFDNLIFLSVTLSNFCRKTYADEILITAPEGTEAVGDGDQWIIVFNDEDDALNGDGCEENMERLVEEKVDQFAAAMAAKDAAKAKKRAKIKQKMTKTLKAVAVEEMDEETATEFTKLPQVAYVEQNIVMSIDAQTTWGIDRIDQRDLPLDNEFTPTGTGYGVAAYVIDTGVEINHDEFGGPNGRARWGINTSQDGNDSDCHGHGTHVAGTVGGTVYGVAKDVEIVAVKVLACNGQGTTLGVIQGVEWVAQDAEEKGKPATANMSLGGGFSQSLNDAVKALHNSGVPTVVAAGNSNADACAHSPASEPVVITVGSTTNNDSRSGFSNYGSCVDIFAPGSGITAAWKDSTSATNTISGTSMASPHVCGAAAILLENGIDPSNIAAELTSRATQGVVTDAKDNSPNLLLYAGAIGPTNAPTPSPPTAAPTDCTQSTITITVTPDNYPQETGWELINDCTGEVVDYREKYLVAGREETDEYCVSDGQYTFTITDKWNDGMCCMYGNGSFKVAFDGVVKKEGGEFGTSDTTQFGSCISETSSPTSHPTTSSPTSQPTTSSPTAQPTTSSPTAQPTTSSPTAQPTTSSPTVQPTTSSPTAQPTTSSPTAHPTSNPTSTPTSNPTSEPTSPPTVSVIDTTANPTSTPTSDPTSSPIVPLTDSPTSSPVVSLTDAPTSSPVVSLTDTPTSSPISSLTDTPTSSPILSLTDSPTSSPTLSVDENWQMLFKDTFENGESDIFRKKKFEKEEDDNWIAWLGGKAGSQKNIISSKRQKFDDSYSDFRLQFSYKCDGEGFKVNINCATADGFFPVKEYKKGTDFVENDQWVNEALDFNCPEATKKLNIQFEGILGKSYFDFVMLSGKSLDLPENADSSSIIEDPAEGETVDPWSVVFEDMFEDGSSRFFKQQRFLDNENAQHGKWVAWLGGKKNKFSTRNQNVDDIYSDFRLEFSYKSEDVSEGFKVNVNYGTGFELLKEVNLEDNIEMNDKWIDEVIEFSHLVTEGLKIQFEGAGSRTYYDYVKLLAKRGSIPEGRDNGDESVINDIPEGHDEGDEFKMNDTPIEESPEDIKSEEVLFYEQFNDVDSTEFGDLSSNLVTEISHSENGSYSVTMKALKSQWITNISSFSKFEVSFYMLREALENDAGLRLEYNFGSKFRLANEWTVTEFDEYDKWVKISTIIAMPKRKKDKLKLKFQGFGSNDDIGIYIDDLKLIGIP